MYKHILIFTEGSNPSEKAIEHLIALAKTLRAKVLLSRYRSYFTSPHLSRAWLSSTVADVPLFFSGPTQERARRGQRVRQAWWRIPVSTLPNARLPKQIHWNA